MFVSPRIDGVGVTLAIGFFGKIAVYFRDDGVASRIGVALADAMLCLDCSIATGGLLSEVVFRFFGTSTNCDRK